MFLNFKSILGSLEVLLKSRCNLTMNFLGRSSNLIFNKLIVKQHFSSKPAKEIEKLVTNNKVVVFMKGVPEQPQCGFSNAVVQILRMHGVKYDAHNVLKDEGLRQGEFK